MRKKFFLAALVLALASSMMFTSCIGNFALTHRVLNWNKQIDNKFVNELVFFAFWVLPVYEISAVADLLVINSIEFWSGTNPAEAYTKTIDTEHGRYIVKCDDKGYNITNETLGTSFSFAFDTKSQTWSFCKDDVTTPFMTFVDNTHVRMLSPDGEFVNVELSNEGLYAYRNIACSNLVALR